MKSFRNLEIANSTIPDTTHVRDVNNKHLPLCAQTGEDVVMFVLGILDRMLCSCMPNFRLPRIFAGHRIRSDTHADLAFTFGLLHAFGIEGIADIAIPEAIATTLRGIDGKQTRTFASYRIAETLCRFGAFNSNDLLTAWSDVERANIAVACDSSESIVDIDTGRLSRNYTAVLARCEFARAKLGLTSEDNPQYLSLLRKVVVLLQCEANGYLDDSPLGSARYDIYTPEFYLLTEPFSDCLGESWKHGARNVIQLLERTTSTDGTSICWGRSSGVLATCLTIELGSLALRDGLATNPSIWLTLVQLAMHQLPHWFSDEGLITSHQRGSTYSYRGSHRRLQMTFDCLGKLVWSALALRAAAPIAALRPASLAVALPKQDTLVWFNNERKAAVWCFRNRNVSFVLPIVGSTLNDYLPTPRNPGLFEVPVEADLPSGTPLVCLGDDRFVGAHLPIQIEKVKNGLSLTYHGYPLSGQWDVIKDSKQLGGTRSVAFRVSGRTINIQETLSFDILPDTITLQVTETNSRPLNVRFECSSSHTALIINTKGVKEYRSYWDEISRVHQLDVKPAKRLTFSYSITPLLRVLSGHANHLYHRTIYDNLALRVSDRLHDLARSGNSQSLLADLRHCDIFHLHWPEHIGLGSDLEAHTKLIRALAECSVKVVWTQHNLVPHSKDERFIPIFQAWAEIAAGIIHHSHWGMARALASYTFRPGAIHHVIPHPSFGPLSRRKELDTTTTEIQRGTTTRLRLGIIGAPRQEKQVQMAMQAFEACDRDDLELLVLSLGLDDPLPTDPRITAHRYSKLPRDVYNAWLATIDLLIMPFKRDGMLGTGTVGDAIAFGIPALVSDWPFLSESLGAAAIPYGSTMNDLINTLQSLTLGDVTKAAEAMSVARRMSDPVRVAERTFKLLEAIGTEKI